MFHADYTPAVTAQGKIDRLNYYTGLFSNATDKNMDEAFFDLNSGYSLLASAYYDLGPTYGTDNLTLYASYLYSNANQQATNLDYFDHGISSALIMTKESASLVTELTSGINSENGNAIGINLQPGVFLTDNLQLVGRYQLALSNSKDGLKPQRRYESEIDLPSGDRYQAVYSGLNYYIARHRLKVMSGVEYSRIGSEEAWTYSTMFRFYFGPHSGGAFPMNQVLPGAFEVD
jgi:phosphate-selective porin OprO/OprP